MGATTFVFINDIVFKEFSMIEKDAVKPNHLAGIN